MGGLGIILVQLMFLFQTGSWVSQQLLTCMSVTSTLNAQIFQEACVTAGSAALAAQIRKHRVNDERCRDLGWACIPLAVETYGCWGTEAIQALSRLATRLSTRQERPKSLVSNEIFGRLSLALVRANSRAILSRSV